MMTHRLSRSVLNASLSVLLLASTLPLASAQNSSLPVQEFTLPSGQKVYIKENHEQPIVTLDTWIKTGSVNEDPHNNGVSHFLEHLIFKGTDKYKAGEVDRILESKGSEFNAATSDDYTHYYITTATPFFPEALKLHADMLLNATVPPEELTQERKVVQEEINRALDNPDRKMFIEMAKILYGPQGYGLDTLGPKENIANIPRQDILSYYHGWYEPKNFSTVIVGDVNAKQALALVRQAFTKTEKKPVASPKPFTAKPVPLTAPKTKVLSDPNITQSYLTLAFPGPSIQARQDAYALDVAMSVLGSGLSSRLNRVLKEEKPLASSVGAGNYTQKYAGTLLVNAEMKPENLTVVKEEIIHQLQELKAKGITPTELEKAKTQTIKDFIFNNEATDGVANSIGYNVTIGTLRDYTDYVGNIQKVSLADVQKAVSRYLNFNQAVLVELVPQGSPTPLKTAETQNLQLLKQAASGISKPTVQTSSLPTEAVTKAAPVKETLANGMTLLTKPVKNSETVAIKVFVKGGQRVEDVPGISPLVSALLMKGTQERSAEAINQELETRGMQLSISPKEDYIEVTGSTVKDDFGELFLILQDVLTHPTFAPAQIDKQKELLKQAIHASQDNPSSVALENMTTALYPNHPYGNVGKRIEPHLALITRENLLDYYHTYFVPNNMVVSVVGNFKPEVLKSYLLTAFPASLNPQEKAAPSAQTADIVPDLAKDKVIEAKKNLQGATWIAQAWLAPTISEQQDYVPLKVLNSLLGTGMSSRLFRDLREKQGLAYVVNSFYPTKTEKSFFALYLGTDPKNQETVLKGFQQEIQRLLKEPVGSQELQEAKDKLAGAFALAHETNLSQATYLGMYETLGVGYGYDAQYPSLMQKVTAADIQRVAQKYFSQPMITSVVMPQAVSPKSDAAAQ